MFKLVLTFTRTVLNGVLSTIHRTSRGVAGFDDACSTSQNVLVRFVVFRSIHIANVASNYNRETAASAAARFRM